MGGSGVRQQGQDGPNTLCCSPFTLVTLFPLRLETLDLTPKVLSQSPSPPGWTPHYLLLPVQTSDEAGPWGLVLILTGWATLGVLTSPLWASVSTFGKMNELD